MYVFSLLFFCMSRTRVRAVSEIILKRNSISKQLRCMTIGFVCRILYHFFIYFYGLRQAISMGMISKSEAERQCKKRHALFRHSTLAQMQFQSKIKLKRKEEKKDEPRKRKKERNERMKNIATWDKNSKSVKSWKPLHTHTHTRIPSRILAGMRSTPFYDLPTDQSIANKCIV